MAVNTGRTTSRYIKFLFSDGSAMRSLAVDTINGVGLTYEEKGSVAFFDAIKGALLDTPDCRIDIAGPFDTTANGAHAVLNAANGVNIPRSLDVQAGIRQAWESGEPQFGITATAASGFLCSSYMPDLKAGTYTASFCMMAGSSAPAWGTAAETVS